jgi:hypothetical protein
MVHMDTTLATAARTPRRLKRIALAVAVVLLLGSGVSIVNYNRACPQGREVTEGFFGPSQPAACEGGVAGYTTDRLAWFFSNL